jgi:hypothetical protein
MDAAEITPSDRRPSKNTPPAPSVAFCGLRKRSSDLIQKNKSAIALERFSPAPSARGNGEAGDPVRWDLSRETRSVMLTDSAK